LEVDDVRRLSPLTLLLAAVATASAAEAQDASRRIEERFLAPCCWRENLAVHRSPEAEEMRAEILQLVKSGKTESEIVDFYVARYGERILREPRGGLSLWLSVVPMLVILAGALLVAGYIVRARRRLAEVAPAEALPPLPDVEERWR
jgi:cytochrome c-type biogenesis protein CcmH